MVHFEVAIDNEMADTLQHIDRKIIDKATLRSLKQIARPVLNTVKNYVPVDTHLLQTDMTMAGFINNKNRDVAVVHVGLAKKNHPQYLIVRGLAMEYGNERVAAIPFLSRAARKHRKPTYNQFLKFMQKHLDKL